MTLKLLTGLCASACASALLLAAAPAEARPAKAHHASAPAAKAAHPAYAGQFVSECDQMAVGLYTRDIVELKPLSPQRIEAKYHKAIFTSADCALASRLGTLHLPVASWQLDGSIRVGKSKADRVTVHMPEGLITATVDQADKFKETEQNWVLSIGNEQVPIEKASAALVEKDLRLQEGDTLYFGDPGSPDAQGYPQEALRNHPLKRQQVAP